MTDERQVTINISPKVSLSGSLLDPSKSDKKLLVVFVAGSGAVDRNENASLQKLNTFNALAKSVADGAGMASFRYDKRGTGKSKGNFLSTGLYDLLDDLVAVIDHLLSKEQNGRYSEYKIILVGHSEGTLLSAMANEKRPDQIDSIVLLCPFVTPMEEILASQAVMGDKSIKDAPGCTGSLARCIVSLFGLQSTKVQKKLVERIKGSSKPTISFYFNKIPALWFREHFALDYEEVYRKITSPTLIVVAEFDAQCDPADGMLILNLIPSNRGKLITISKLSHLLRKSETNEGFLQYGKQIRKPIDDEVKKVLVDWCLRRAPDLSTTTLTE